MVSSRVESRLVMALGLSFTCGDLALTPESNSVIQFKLEQIGRVGRMEGRASY
jgi:hypothetical protein